MGCRSPISYCVDSRAVALQPLGVGIGVGAGGIRRMVVVVLVAVAAAVVVGECGAVGQDYLSA